MTLQFLGWRWEMGFQREGENSNYSEKPRDGGVELCCILNWYCNIGGKGGLGGDASAVRHKGVVTEAINHTKADEYHGTSNRKSRCKTKNKYQRGE